MKEEQFFHFTKKPKQYKSVNELRIQWLNSIIRKIKEPIFIIDKGEIDNLMENVIHPELKK